MNTLKQQELERLTYCLLSFSLAIFMSFRAALFYSGMLFIIGMLWLEPEKWKGK